MAIPSLIEIAPLAEQVQADVAVPGSKSITNRALVLAALARNDVFLQDALWSEDTQVMVECLQTLGFDVAVHPAAHVSNRSIRVRGEGGRIPRAGTAEKPLELFVGNAGTAARFLAALVCLGRGAYRLSGVHRMHERPQAALFKALRQLGYRIDSPNDKLPAVIHCSGPRPGKCEVSIAESSQFASALLLSAKAGEWQVTVTGENAEESAYVAMTTTLMRNFPHAGGEFEIEPDASSASYLWGANWLLQRNAVTSQSRVSVQHWPTQSLQIDAQFPQLWPTQPKGISRQDQLGDSIMTAIVLAPFGNHDVRFTELGRLRVQECERVAALRTELSKCGARVEEIGDSLRVYPGTLHGAEIETYNDHRMAMCFGLLGLVVPGMRLKNPACVRKTFPDFFQRLSLPAPDGLGASILDVARGRRLEPNELLA
ncbi:MAG TPA: 3-phosphoshikimate 1-carboxyvinyltransferase [Methylomirabilota bacterium]|nr:3-phosphoshikimate 1-carboxyvinyltransferase [Methylomirabilota bacterium]